MERDVRAMRARDWAWLSRGVVGEDGDSDAPAATADTVAEEQGR